MGPTSWQESWGKQGDDNVDMFGEYVVKEDATNAKCRYILDCILYIVNYNLHTESFPQYKYTMTFKLPILTLSTLSWCA